MSATSQETQVLDDLDFKPRLPCEVDVQHKDGKPPPAKWIVYFRDPQPCGHRAAALTMLMCDPCLRLYLQLGVTCQGRSYPLTACARTWEPL